jgi:23S rRNA G2445 N2-methylase RlmL
MDPTIAYAVNSLCGLESANSYLNVFSGNATLLIEAGQCYEKIEKIMGFDNNKRHISLSIQNIKKAGLIKKIQVKEADIIDNPDFGKFDVIVSDLPFGMIISKNEDLENLYTAFIKYCEKTLKKDGRLAIYTSQYEIIESVLVKSEFRIIQSIQLRLMTSVGAYLKPKIIVCKF